MVIDCKGVYQKFGQFIAETNDDKDTEVVVMQSDLVPHLNEIHRNDKGKLVQVISVEVRHYWRNVWEIHCGYEPLENGKA